MSKPRIKPANPQFSTGPCKKRSGWSLAELSGYSPGRSHRSQLCRRKLAEVTIASRRVLQIPEDWRIGIVPASDTGAVEIALWNLLGERGVDALVWESFGRGWLVDVRDHLKLDDVRIHAADYGYLPDLSQIDSGRDVVFTWNGTTSGVRVPNADWISETRTGLTICDATSAAFAVDLPWEKLDVVTYSWQKVMGGEGAHGMLILSPAAVNRLETFVPARPLPKIFRLTKNGKLIDGIFQGVTINTPSMLAVEDALDGLTWAESIGGLPALIKRCNRNASLVQDWIDQRDWVCNLAVDPQTRSNTSVCLKITDPAFDNLPEDDQRARVKAMVQALEAEAAAFDVIGYPDALPGLRIWTGATIEPDDLEALFPWLDWAFEQFGRDSI